MQYNAILGCCLGSAGAISGSMGDTQGAPATASSGAPASNAAGSPIGAPPSLFCWHSHHDDGVRVALDNTDMPPRRIERIRKFGR